MRTRILIACLLVSSCLFPGAQAWADAAVSDWIGEYTMNHDGHVGTLRIRGTKGDCGSPGCDLALDYLDANGNRTAGRIGAVDQSGQHMRFWLVFPGNNQPFDAWIFSWDKNYMAGTTMWGNRTFGFLAAKGGASLGMAKKLNADGTVGTPREESPSSDGISSRSFAIETPVATPPDPPGGSDVASWLEFENNTLLAILNDIVRDKPTVDAFVAQDPNEAFGRATRRIRALRLLLEP